MHKGSTPFGSALWLSIKVDKTPQYPSPMPPSTTTTIIATTPLSLAEELQQPLTNDNLLQSIGFLPSPEEEEEEEEEEEWGGRDSESSAVVIDFPPLLPSSPPPTILELEPGPLSVSSDHSLLYTFDVVETPTTSLASNDSLHQPSTGEPLKDEEEEEEDNDSDTASVASGESDDFVVIVPDCFDLNKPLSQFPLAYQELEASALSSVTPPLGSCDGSHVTQTRDGDISDAEVIEKEATIVSSETVNSSVKSTSEEDTPTTTDAPLPSDGLPTPDDVPLPKPSSATASPATSPPTGRKAEFVPSRITLKNVKDARMYHSPLAVATGLVNTVSDLVQDHVHLVPPATAAKKQTPRLVLGEDSDSEDNFEVHTCTIIMHVNVLILYL